MTEAVPTGTHDVQGKVIAVTGAGQGIGRGIAMHLAKCGAKVVIAEWKEPRADRTAAEIVALGGDALAVITNVMERESIKSMVRHTLRRYGRIDGLVNNAHTFTRTVALADATDKDMDTNYVSGVKGTLWGMQAVHPFMKRQGWGRIVNLVSAAGITGMPDYGPYNAAKEAVRALTRTAAREWGRDGIVVNAIAPGAASKRGHTAASQESEAFRDFIQTHPMGRQGDPEEDIGPVAAFLCSEASRYVTGMTFMVDGGAFIHS